MTYKDKLKKKIRESGIVTNVQRNEYERNVDKIVEIVVNELQNFSAFLNNYPNFEDVRFDWMLLDYFDVKRDFHITDNVKVFYENNRFGVREREKEVVPAIYTKPQDAVAELQYYKFKTTR